MSTKLPQGERAERANTKGDVLQFIEADRERLIDLFIEEYNQYGLRLLFAIQM